MFTAPINNAAKQHIAQDLVLMHRHNGALPRTSARAPQPIVPGGLTAWQRRRIATHIDAHLGTGIRIKDLARFLCLSYSHFCRVFRISFGISPHLYVTRRRIELAQTLMLTTPTNLSEIALACGMSDQSHLTRVFRRIVGYTPHAWRRSRLSGNCNEPIAVHVTKRRAQGDVEPFVGTPGTLEGL